MRGYYVTTPGNFGLGAGEPQVWQFGAAQSSDAALATALATGKQVKTEGQLHSLVAHASFPSDDWRLLQDLDVRLALRSFLIDRYFTDLRRVLDGLYG